VSVSQSEACALSICGELVTQLKFDFGFSIVTDGSETRIETTFRIAGPDMEVQIIDPAALRQADALVKLHQTTVDGDCFNDGSLHLKFSNGSAVNVPANDHYEAWTLTRRNGEMAVSRPGGGLTEFGPRR
jgi:hypothetical protein